MFSFRHRFRRDRRGGVAIVLALALVPLVGVAGTAVDYGRSINLRLELQKVADTAALMAAQGNEPFETRQQAAEDYLDREIGA